MSVKNRTENIIYQTSIELGIPVEKVKFYAERGSEIAFRKSFEELIELMITSDDEDAKIKDILQICIDGGKIEELLEK